MDRRAMLADLVREHQAGVWRYLRYLGAETSEADDLTQETFLAVMRSGFEYRSPAEASQYLRGAARHQLLMLRRRQNREPTVGDLEAAEAVWTEAAGDDDLSDYLLALEDCLQRAIDGRAREAIWMRYRDDASHDQIGQQFGISIEGAKTLLRRAKAALRDCVERKVGT